MFQAVIGAEVPLGVKSSPCRAGSVQVAVGPDATKKKMGRPVSKGDPIRPTPPLYEPCPAKLVHRRMRVPYRGLPALRVVIRPGLIPLPSLVSRRLCHAVT